MLQSQAPCEAEAQCSALCKAGKVWIVVLLMILKVWELSRASTPIALLKLYGQIDT